MPIYEYNGKKYDIPAEKESGLITRMPGAKKVDGAPFYLSPVNQPTPVEQAPEINADVPPTSQTTFDIELAKQTAQKQPESRLN